MNEVPCHRTGQPCRRQPAAQAAPGLQAQRPAQPHASSSSSSCVQTKRAPQKKEENRPMSLQELQRSCPCSVLGGLLQHSHRVFSALLPLLHSPPFFALLLQVTRPASCMLQKSADSCTPANPGASAQSVAARQPPPQSTRETRNQRVRHQNGRRIYRQVGAPAQRRIAMGGRTGVSQPRVRRVGSACRRRRCRASYACTPAAATRTAPVSPSNTIPVATQSEGTPPTQQVEKASRWIAAERQAVAGAEHGSPVSREGAQAGRGARQCGEAAAGASATSRPPHGRAAKRSRTGRRSDAAQERPCRQSPHRWGRTNVLNPQIAGR